MKKIQFLIFIILLISWACTKIDISANRTEKAVLEGFLYVNQPVTEIRITNIIPKDGIDSTTLPITDAEVFITTEGKKYKLSPNANRLGYYQYMGNDLQVVAGKTYGIQFDYYGRTTAAETTAPSAPKDIAISSTKMYLSKVNSRIDLFNNASTEDINITWNNASQDYFYIVIDNLEAVPEKIIADAVFPDRVNRNFSFISSPTRGSNFKIRFLQLEQFGKHRLKLFRVNKEYADLYNSQQQDSRSLNEPLTNVKNGLGVFTAFNMDSVFFEVKKK